MSDITAIKQQSARDKCRVKAKRRSKKRMLRMIKAREADKSVAKALGLR